MELKVLKQLDAKYEETLVEMFDQLRPEQQDLFRRMYPEGIGKMESRKIRVAIEQCERTINDNLLGKE